MLLQELIGKKITNIFQILEFESYGLDRGECFVELDNNTIIEIPGYFDDEVSTKELDQRAVSIFNNLSDYPVKDRVIKDLIIFEDNEKAFIELDNGYYISETNYSMNGTGRIGINLYDNLNVITKWKGSEFKRISNYTS